MLPFIHLGLSNRARQLNVLTNWTTAIGTFFEIRLSNLLARKLQNYNIYIDSIEKNWQKSPFRINFHWP